jgi:basic amino acid/polyamine antiporter, APA family
MLAGGEEDRFVDNQESFVRVLGQKDVIALAFGAMIGFGWVVLVGTWLLDAGSLGAIIAFLIGGILVVFVGLTYSELVSAMPKAGGEHNYAWRALGPTGGFVASWAIALGYVSVVAFEAVALPTAVNYLAPLETGSLWTVAGYDVYLSWVAVGLIGAVVITALNYIGIRPSAIFQFIAVLFLVGIALLFLLGTFVGGSAQNFTPLFAGGHRGTPLRGPHDTISVRRVRHHPAVGRGDKFVLPSDRDTPDRLRDNGRSLLHHSHHRCRNRNEPGGSTGYRAGGG